MSHTPGPWHWYGNKGLEGSSETVLVGDCGLASCGRTRLYVSEADMRLIAAAPELLAALKAFRRDHELSLSCYQFERESVGDNLEVEAIDQRCEECRLADLAIAKAEGR